MRPFTEQIEMDTSMSGTVPKVTVLLPVFNTESYVGEAISSILNQSFRNFELLIINDGSTDGSIDIIRSFSDPRIRILENEKNMGLIATLNRGLDLVNTTYLARADADDICLPERLEKQFMFMEANPEIGACGTWFDTIADGHVRSGVMYEAEDGRIKMKHMYQIQMSHGTIMIRTEVLKKNGLKYDGQFAHAEDYDLFDRIGSISKLANLPEVLYHVRHHEGRVSISYSDIQTKNSLRVKNRIFQRIGLEGSQTEIGHYTELLHQNYAIFRNRPDDVKNLLNKLYHANLSSGTFDRAAFNRQLHHIWLNFNLNVAARDTFGPEMFKKAMFAHHFKLKLADRLKLHIWPLIR